MEGIDPGLFKDAMEMAEEEHNKSNLHVFIQESKMKEKEKGEYTPYSKTIETEAENLIERLKKQEAEATKKFERFKLRNKNKNII